jgi:cytochrome c553
MPKLILACLFLLISCNGPISAPVDQLAPNQAAIINHCKTCHSTHEMQRGPLLEGLELWYMEEQLESYKAGIRGIHADDQSGQLMHAAVKDWSLDDLYTAAKWFANQERPKLPNAVKGDILKGKALYKQVCFACHEHTMGKFFTRSPDLYRLEDWYILSQLRNYKSGWRGTHPDDEHGQKMKAAIEALSYDELKNVAAYIGTLDGRPPIEK